MEVYSEATDQLGTFTMSSITILGHPHTVPLFTILLPLLAGTADRSHFLHLSSKLPLPHDQSHLHYRDMLENGGEFMLKYPPLLGTGYVQSP